MFLHYPPTSIGEMESPFTRMAQEYGASKVIYSHCHGRERFDDSFKGDVDGIEYKLVSGEKTPGSRTLFVCFPEFLGSENLTGCFHNRP